MKPLPAARLTPNKAVNATATNTSGIMLSPSFYWNPLSTANPHFCGIGMSGMGKTQTLKAIAIELRRVYPDIRIIVIDYHGDLELNDETLYELNQESPHGINPLVVDIDPKGGGPNLQAIAVAATLKRALTMGPNQEGLLIELLTDCYKTVNCLQSNLETWKVKPPTFSKLQELIVKRIADGCKESPKLALKLAASFQYGIFNKPQPSLNHKLIRFELTSLAKAPGLCAIATEALLKQLMDTHRLLGAVPNTIRTYVLIDEAKEIKASPSLKTIVRDGRKYGLGIGLMSQMPSDYTDDIIANTATKIVLGVDSSEVKKTAIKFRFGEGTIANLKPLEALVRVGTKAEKIEIVPYYQRI